MNIMLPASMCADAVKNRYIDQRINFDLGAGGPVLMTRFLAKSSEFLIQTDDE